MLLLPQQPSQSICKPFIFGFVSSSCVSRPPRCLHLPTFPRIFDSCNPHITNNLAVGVPPALTLTAATAAEVSRHDAHKIIPSEPDTKQSRPHLAHMDPQHRLDHPAINIARRALRAGARWLLPYPLISLRSLPTFAPSIRCGLRERQNKNPRRKTRTFLDLRASAQICGYVFLNSCSFAQFAANKKKPGSFQNLACVSPLFVTCLPLTAEDCLPASTTQSARSPPPPVRVQT